MRLLVRIVPQIFSYLPYATMASTPSSALAYTPMCFVTSICANFKLPLYYDSFFLFAQSVNYFEQFVAILCGQKQ